MKPRKRKVPAPKQSSGGVSLVAPLPRKCPPSATRTMSDLEILSLHYALTWIHPAGGKAPEMKVLMTCAGAMAMVSEVCAVLHVDINRVRSSERTQHVAFARQLCMFIVRDVTTMSFPLIGEMFDRDLSTAIHAFNLITRRIKSDQAFAGAIRKLVARVRVAAGIDAAPAAEVRAA